MTEATHSSSPDDEYLYSTGRDKIMIQLIHVKINDKDMKMIIDTGASTNS